MEDKKYILGLDISTTTIGISLFEDLGKEGKLTILEHITPKIKGKDISAFEKLLMKADIFYDTFFHKFDEYNIDRIIIEEPLLRSNNVNTVATLLRFNGILSKMLYDKYNILPEFISSYDARKFGFPELMGKRTHNGKGVAYTEKQLEKIKETLFFEYDTKTVNKKLVIWEKVAKVEPQIQWLYKKNGNLADENFDMADAYVLVPARMRQLGLWD